MLFYLNGKTIPGGTGLIEALPYDSISAALAAATDGVRAGMVSYWIVDQHGMMIMTAKEVSQRCGVHSALRTPPDA